jgi:membrane associated rhomboid family serine protease
MGIYDRDYTQADQGGPSWRGSSGTRIGLPPLTTAVKWLLILNIAIFLVEAISGQMDKPDDIFLVWGGLYGPGWLVLQVWRLVTYQFLHGGMMHLVFNMLTLYMFGPKLEMWWGTRKFTAFYLLCGVAAGAVYLIATLTSLLSPGVLVGASGSILGILAACAILFPRDILLLFGFIPMPMWVAGILFVVLYVFSILSGQQNAGGNIAHLGGMAAGAAYCWLGPKLSGMMTSRRRSAWDRKMDQQRKLQLEVDRILDKVHEQGISSLTRGEKKMLQEATRLEQERLRTGR